MSPALAALGLYLFHTIPSESLSSSVSLTIMSSRITRVAIKMCTRTVLKLPDNDDETSNGGGDVGASGSDCGDMVLGH